MKELLVPVGSFAALKVAIHSGADAVYLGGKKFGARAFANNFDDEEMVNAIHLCHLYGVRIYVTVNTLCHESEINDVLDYIKFLYLNHVDAIIVQDIGIISTCKKLYPELEIHASTQVHNTNQDTFKFLEELGVKRVVLAREVDIDTIDSINTPLEKEAFIHGALCISYSGECLFSSILLNRSGNRGECAQICRLPFKLMKNNELVDTKGEYLLSTKELNTSTSFKRILDSSVYSLKIEGRMKSPEYVGCVTKLYRDLLDKYYRGEELTVNETYYNDLLTIFNRKYTSGFILNASNEELMNIITPNHLGTPLGVVEKISNKYIQIKLKKQIHQEDGIRFMDSKTGLITNYIYDLNGKLINGSDANNSILIDNKVKVRVGEQVNKTFDKVIAKTYNNPEEKKIPINYEFTAEFNKSITLTISDTKNTITITGNVPEKSKTSPITEEDIKKSLNKLGNTPFISKNINIILDNDLFISLKELNEIRREAIEKLIDRRSNYETSCPINTLENQITNSYDDTKTISALCRQEDQVRASLDLNINRIYITDYALYKKYKEYNNVYYRSLRNGIKSENEGLGTDLGSIYRNNNIYGDYYLNVTNHLTIDYLSKYTKSLTLSPELTNNEISNIMNYYHNKLNIEFIIYGTLELMLLKYCPLKLNINKDKVCNVCNSKDNYYLIDKNNNKYPIIQDKYIHLTHILDSKPINKIKDIAYYLNLGIINYRLEFSSENYEESKQVIMEIKKSICYN